MSSWLPASEGTENQIGGRLYKTMSVRLMTFTEGGNMLKGGKLCQLLWWQQLPSRRRWKKNRACFYLPGYKRTPCWVGRWWGSLVMWTPRRWCCGPTCHSRSGWGSGRHVRLGSLEAERQRTEQTDRWVIESGDQWGNDWKAGRVEGGLAGARKGKSRQGGKAGQNEEKIPSMLWYKQR